MMPIRSLGVDLENQAFNILMKRNETGFVSLREACPILPVREVL